MYHSYLDVNKENNNCTTASDIIPYSPLWSHAYSNYFLGHNNQNSESLMWPFFILFFLPFFLFVLYRMTKYDIKNYLEKIYNTPVGAVRTRIQFGKSG